MSESKNRLNIHAQIQPPTHEPTPTVAPRKHRHFFIRKHIERPKLTFSDRLIRNSALSCALLLAILAMGNLNQPWAKRISEGVERALTMHIDLDESIGQLSFVREIMPESALVFLNLSGEPELKQPVSGELTHAYSASQPWLMFGCAEGSAVVAAEDGVITAVSTLSNGAIGILIDHGNGLESVYAYLSDTSVQQGDSVARGDPIGISGSSVYFELRENDTPIDPTERMKR